MKKETYLRLYRWASPHAKALEILNRTITLGVYVWFCGAAAFLLFASFWVGVRVLLTCGISFVGLTFFRKAVNAPRPYEVFGISPVIPKDTKGKSFPSRHVFSIFIIAVCSLFLFPAVGAALCVIGVALAALRVATGVHFLKDVLAGALVGIVCGLAGMCLPV